MSDVDKLLSELLDSDDDSEGEDSQQVVDPGPEHTGGAHHPPVFATSTNTLGDRLPSSSPESLQHPEEIITVLSTEVPNADKQPMQNQNEPVDPFMPSASALPDFMLQNTIQSSDAAAASLNQSAKNSSLLDADMPQASQLLFGNQQHQPNRGLSAAMPYAATAAATAADIDRAHPRSAQLSCHVYEGTPEGSETLSVDRDAQDIALTTSDLPPSSSPSQKLAISQDTAAGDAQSEMHGGNHFATEKNHQLELQKTSPPESSELNSLSPKSPTSILPASEAVTSGAQTMPDTSLVPSTVPKTQPAPAPFTAASDMVDQQANPTSSDAVFASIHSSSAKDQQPQPQQQQPASRDEGDAEVDMPKHDALLKPHETAMAKAEEAERRLLTDKSIPASQAEQEPAEGLMSRLQWAAEDWPELGSPDTPGGVLGGQVMMRLDLLNPFQEFFSGGSSMGASPGSSRAVAAFRGVVAVGTSSSIVGVLMPRGLSADGHPSGQARVVQLGDPKSEDYAVTCMAFSLQGNILLVGHASGEVVLWEFKRTGWEAVKAVKDAHTAPLTTAAFLESSSQLAITGDAKGRLVLHNVTAYLSITSIFAGRLSRSSQPVMLLDGQQLGPVCKVVPLHPTRAAASHAAAAAPDHTRPQSPQEAAALQDGLFLAATLGGMLVARAAPDGRFTVLHNLARPPDAREGCLPYPTWQPRTPASRPASSSTRQAPSATLVLAWERKIYLMDVPLAGLPGAAPPEHSAASRGPMALPPARVIKSWESEHVVAGVCWLNEHALAVVSEQGPRSHVRLYDASGNAVKEKLVFEDSLVGAQYIVNSQGIPEQACHTALALTPERMLLLGSQGVRSARLLTWQERLAALRELLLWDHALFLGLQVYKLATPPAAVESGDTSSNGRSLWREEGHDADLSAVCVALIALLLGYLDAALPHHQQHSGQAAAAEEDMQAAGAADTAIELCMLIRRADVLWGEVYPRYLACGQHPALLERLLPHILASKLPSFPPEVMQALVEHFSQKGQPEAVEKAVLHMDITSLDLNQIIRLCWQYDLLTALSYILNRGLNDYMGPAAALLMPLLLASDGSSSRKAGYRLLVYLRCCLTGQSFPPGSGSLPEALVPLVKAQLLAFLIYTTPALLQQQLQGAGQAPEKAQEGSGEDAVSELGQKLPRPCPVLRRLISFDPGAVLGVLQQSLAGWEALETDLLEAANLDQQAAQLGERVRSATQVVVDAILDLLDVGVFRQSEGHTADSTAEALLFVTGLLVEGRATADAAATLKVLGHLAQEPQPGSEGAFVAVLQTATLQGSDMDQAVQLAQEAGFQQAVARAHYLAGHFLQALHCAIHATSTAGAAFKYIRDVLDEAHLSQDRSAAFRAAVVGSIADLARNETFETATLILERFPEEHGNVVASLADQPQLQYKYLQASTQVSGASKAVESEVWGSEEGWGGRPGSSAGVHDELLAQPAMCEQFVALLCRFEASAVLPFLQSHDSYRVEACLPPCQQYGVRDAQAYLLERLGDIAAAIKLYVRDIECCNAALIQAVLQGDVHLPNVTTASGRLAGYAGSASLFSYSSGHTLLERRASSPRAAGQLDCHVGQAPLVASHQALKSAVALCQRHSLEASQDTAHHLWFQLLQCYVHQLRQIRQDGQQSGHQPQAGPPLAARKSGDADWSLLSPRGDQSNFDPNLALPLTRLHPHSILHSAATATTEAEKWAALQQLFTSFMEEVISGMAGYIPLKAIGQRILAQYTQQQFGDFRGTLLGLLSAYNYESSILTTASRLMGSDAFRSLFTLYQSKTRVSTHVQMVSHSLMTHPEPAQGTGADDHQEHIPLGAAGQEAANGLRVNLTPASEQSKASQRLLSQNNDDFMTDSPAYRSGVDINFLRSHEI